MDCHGALVPVRSLTKIRVVALVVVGFLVAPAITECAGWAASATGRHICCGNRGGMASETRMTDCCAMSEQSSDTAPPETQASRPSLKLLTPHFVPVVDIGALRAPIPDESFTARRAPVVPLYLQQASLLI